MKSISTLALFILCGLSVNAQTLTQSFNEPIIGDEQKVVRLDTTLMNPINTLSITGQNVNWNFSLLKTASDPLISVFSATAAIPSATAYAGCTLVQDDNGSYTYLKSVSTPTTRTELLGLTLQGSVVTLTNAAIIAQYPIAFGTTFSDNAAGTAVFTGSTLPVSGKSSYTADGTGTLTLADGFIYKNVLRVKTVQTFTATYLFLPVVNVKMTTYDFYDASLKFPVLSIMYQDFNVFGQANTSASYVGNSSSFTGISKHTSFSKQFELVPNPTTGMVNLKTALGTAYTVKVLDYTGKVLGTTAVQAGSELVQIDLSSYASGIYLLQLEAGAESCQMKVLKN